MRDPMGLKVMCAGCSADERVQAESDLRRALGARIRAEPWTVSLVKVQNRWSVTLDGPGTRALTLTAPEDRLADSVRDALAPGISGPLSPAASAEMASPDARHDRHECASCRQPFVVTYEASPNEPEQAAPVACPRCWQINSVLLAGSAAETGDYKAEPV